MHRYREMISQYETGLAFHRRQIEDDQFELGRLDERLDAGRERG
jgi:hypothetical protein